MNIILGQDESTQLVDPNAITGTIWDEINQFCQTRTSPEQCQALLGYRPIYFPPTVFEKPALPFWALLLIGYVAGKHNVI